MKDPLNKLQLNVICVSFHFVSLHFEFNNNTVFFTVYIDFFECDKIAKIFLSKCKRHFSFVSRAPLFVETLMLPCAANLYLDLWQANDTVGSV